MLPRYVQCDYPEGDDGKCGVMSKRLPRSALNHCPRHRARLPYWPTDSVELPASTPKIEQARGAAP